MKHVLTLIVFAFYSNISIAQETIDLSLTSSSQMNCSTSQTLNKSNSIGSSGGYVFTGSTLVIKFTGTQWQIELFNVGIIFTNPSTLVPFPPCLSEGGWSSAGNPTTCYDQILVLSGDGCSIGLPIELINFKVVQNQNTAILKWQTATELNNNFFEIQRSEDGSLFEKIGQVKGHGNSITTNKYTFIDKEMKNGRFYYRLKQVDFDGNFEYHEIISITISSIENQMKVIPTITSDFIKITVPSNRFDKTIQIFSISGQKIKAYSFPKERTEYSMDISHLPNGIYFLKYNFGKKYLTRKMVKR